MVKTLLALSLLSKTVLVAHLRQLNDNSITGPLPKEWSEMANMGEM